MTSRILLLALLLALGGASRASATAAILPDGFIDEPLAGGLNFPVAMAFLPDGRLLFTERYSGGVRLLDDQSFVVSPVAFIDSVRTSPESGLLGVAVDPGWPARPYFYLLYNWTGGPYMRLVRFTASGDLTGTGNRLIDVDPASRFIVFNDLVDERIIHNGGTLRFGPDGLLYATLGEDGTPCYAMFPDSLRGVLMRIDVSQLPAGPGWLADFGLITPPDNPFVAHPNPRARLVWSRGLRNPWNFHHDPATSAIFVADVGDSRYEEIDLVDGPGLYFGYPAWEGYAATIIGCPVWDSTGSRAPIHVYDRTQFEFGAAVISGGLYRRPASGSRRFPAEYDGDYFFSDVGEGFLRRLKATGGGWDLAPPVPGQPNASDWARNMSYVTDYLEAADGSLWYCRHHSFQQSSGEIRRIGWVASTDVPPEPPVAALALEAPWPVPARDRVSFAVRLPADDRVRIVVHDVAGRRVRELAGAATLGAGRHVLEWDGRDDSGAPAPAGLYVIRLAGKSGQSQRRCLLAR